MIRLINSFRYALKGLVTYFRTGGNVTLHLIAIVIVLIFGYVFQISEMQWCFLLICIGLVLSAEAFNTAIEKLADIVKPSYNHEIGKVKDLAAAGVLIMAIISAIISAIIFLPKILHF